MGRSTGKFPVVRRTTGKHKAITGKHDAIQRTLLVVDDEPEIARLISKIFEKLGYRILVASDGEEALARVAAEAPDLVLLDLNLPKLDGNEVCRRLKSNPKTRAIPVILMTADVHSPDEARRALGLGAEEYLMKPFVREVIVHNVERLLARK